jgi:hypothetical protein
MLAAHTPAPEYPMVRNEQLDELQQNHIYEICTFPMHLPDEVCMNMLRANTDPNVILYVAHYAYCHSRGSQGICSRL